MGSLIAKTSQSLSHHYIRLGRHSDVQHFLVSILELNNARQREIKAAQSSNKAVGGPRRPGDQAYEEKYPGGTDLYHHQRWAGMG